MDRREFLYAAGAAGVGLGLAACSGKISDEESGELESDDEEEVEALAEDDLGGLPKIKWEMPTSWPLNLETIYGGAVVFAKAVAALTGGRFEIIPNEAQKLVPGLEVLQNVESGAYPIGHTAGYYYTGKAEFCAFGTALPFGLNSRQQNAWLYEGGGLEMLQDLYAERFGVIQFPAGNTGCQMGGWFNKEVKNTNDLKGLKMRIPGLGGRVMDKLGVAVQQIAGGEIYQGLQTGAIDAAEWVGPYDDLILGFPEVADFYYFPGWWEPGPTLEVQINKGEYDKLPALYKQAIQAAAFKANTIMLARYDKLNPEAVNKIEASGKVQILPYPDDVMVAARDASFELYDSIAAKDQDFKAVLDSWTAYRDGSTKWFGMAEASIVNFNAASTG